MLMKKLLIFIMLTATVLFSSCLNNEEPQSLVDLRNAKATLIQAEAQYKLAEAAYQQAQTEFQNAQTANQLLLNELQTLKNQIMATEVEIAKIKVEIAKAQSEAEKAKWEAQKAQYELDLLNTKNAIEEAIEQHKIDMFALLANVAKAEKDYQDALDLLEAQKLILTPEQQRLIDSYVAALVALKDGGVYTFNTITYNVPKGITTLQQDLVKANDQLAKDKYMWDKESAVNRAKLDSIAAQSNVNNAKEVLADFEAFTKMTDITGWENKVKELEALIVTLELKSDSLEIEIGKFDKKKADIDLVIQGIDNKITALTNEKLAIATNDFGIDDPAWTKKGIIEAEIEALNDEFFNKKHAYTYSIEDKLLQDRLYNQVFSELLKFFTDVSIIDNYERDKVTREYFLPSNKFSVEGKINNMDGFVFNTYFYMSQMVYGASALEDLKQEIVVLKDNYESGIKVQYTEALDKWTTALEGVKTVGEEYLLDRAVDLQELTKRAVAYYATLTTPTDAEKNTMIEAVKKFRNLRDKLEANPFDVVVDGVTKPIQEHLTIDVFNSGKIVLTQIQNAVNVTRLTSASTPIPTRGTSILADWNNSSTALWGQPGMRIAIDKTTFGDSWSMVFNYSPTKDMPVLAANNDLRTILFSLGYAVATVDRNTTTPPYNYFTYYNVPALQGGLWWKYVSADFTINYKDFVVKYQTKITDIAEAAKTKYEEYRVLYKDFYAALTEKDDAIKALIEVDAANIQKLIDEQNILKINEQQKIVEVNNEKALVVQKSNNLDDRILAVNTLKAKYLGFLKDAYDFTTGNFVIFINSKQVQEAFALQILTYKDDIITAEEGLYDAIKVLDMLREGLDGDATAYKYKIAQDEAKIAEITAQLEDLNKRFNDFTELLKKTLAIFTAE